MINRLLSGSGSTRATAYAMSNKIVTRSGRRHLAWLDHVADIQVRTLDVETATWGPTTLADQGVDNHSGPALIADHKGYLPLVYGPHHGPFAYRKSIKPDDASQWSDIEYFSHNATYPSLV